MAMKISIGSDHAGFEQKQELAAYLREQGYDVIDRGPDSDDRVDYPDYAAAVAHDVSNGVADRGVLVCGTGIGMALAADKSLAAVLRTSSTCSLPSCAVSTTMRTSSRFPVVSLNST